MEHRWVRHTITDATVQREKPLPLEEAMFFAWYDPFWIRSPATTLTAEQRIVYGCDNCGLPLSSELFAEPCLASLEDQLEEGGQEDLTS